MKQTIFSIAAMLVLTISATLTHAQMVSFHKNGVMTQIDASAKFTTPKGEMTGMQIAQMWETAYQNSLNVNGGGGQMDLPTNSGNGGNEWQNADNQVTLNYKVALTKKIEAETRATNWQTAYNGIATVTNLGTAFVGARNNWKTTDANVGVLNSQARYIGNMANNMNNNNCCGNNGNGTITGTYPAPNPIYNPPSGTVFYDNRDGNGPYYVASNGQKVYMVPNPGTPIDYRYAGQTPTNNGGNGYYNGYTQGGNSQQSINQLYYTGNMNPGY